MSEHEHENPEPEQPDAEHAEDSGFTGGGGPASVIYGDRGKEEADELGEEMLRAPDEDV